LWAASCDITSTNTWQGRDAIYSTLAATLIVTAFAAIATAGSLLWEGCRGMLLTSQPVFKLLQNLGVQMISEDTLTDPGSGSLK